MFTTARVGTKRRLFSTKRRSRSEHTCSAQLSRAPSTKDVASTYNNMGNVYDSQGQYETACYQKDLDITIRVFGHQHKDVATAKYNIAAEVKKGGEPQTTPSSSWEKLRTRTVLALRDSSQ
jgi:hypothetical protein